MQAPRLTGVLRRQESLGNRDIEHDGQRQRDERHHQGGELAREHPDARFVWVDVEDQSELAGDLDVETFPTLLIADRTQARFLGPLLPQAPVLARLLASV